MKEREWIPGINHIEFWVNSMEESLEFYETLFALIGWKEIGKGMFSSGHIEIYLKEADVPRTDSAGPRHICFQAVSRDVVDRVGSYLQEAGAEMIRGPVEVPRYSKGYYTVDFRDPDGYVLEVAHTPHMKL
ncbi:Catechol 2,3-dioxygenase [Bacillus sp. OV194]|nr:Catechol 2,3-dioxygenase [Bacillus sp. OV194]